MWVIFQVLFTQVTKGFLGLCSWWGFATLLLIDRILGAGVLSSVGSGGWDVNNPEAPYMVP